MSLDTLVAATNTILRLDHPTVGDLLNACEVGCRELEVLSEDDAFFTLLRSAKWRPNAQHTEVGRVFNDLGEFHTFLEAEARILKDSGVDDGAVRDLLNQARQLREHIRDQQVDPDSIREGIAQLRDSTCHMVGRLSLKDAVVDQSKKVRSLLRRVALGIGGGMIAVINGAAEVSLGQLYAHASIDVGVGLVIAAIAELARHAPVYKDRGLAASGRLEAVVRLVIRDIEARGGSMPMAQAGESLAGNDSRDDSPTRSIESSGAGELPSLPALSR